MIIISEKQDGEMRRYLAEMLGTGVSNAPMTLKVGSAAGKNIVGAANVLQNVVASNPIAKRLQDQNIPTQVDTGDGTLTYDKDNGGSTGASSNRGVYTESFVVTKGQIMESARKMAKAGAREIKVKDIVRR